MAARLPGRVPVREWGIFGNMWEGISFAILAASLAFAEESSSVALKSLYEARRWAELHEALGDVKGNNLYRGAVAVVFNQDPLRTENLLLSVIKSAPRSEEAYQAHEWLSHLYLRSGQYRRLLLIMDKQWATFPEKSERKEEEAELGGFRGLPDQIARKTRPSILQHENGSIFIPLSVNGSSATYFFDTGAWVSCMSESEAQRLGLSIRGTSGKMGTMTNSVGFRTAVAREVVVGQIHLKDVSFAIFPDDREPWSVLPPGHRGIIGMPILLAFHTLRWVPEGALEIGGKSSPLEVRKSNLIFDDDHLAVTVGVQGRKGLAALDTGALSTDLYQALAAQFPSLMESGKRESSEVRGVGGPETYESVVIPELRFEVGGLETVLRPARILLNRGPRSYIGNFGMDLLRQARAFKVDFAAMTLDLEASK
jgi:predicted aspartyl protease